MEQLLIYQYTTIGLGFLCFILFVGMIIISRKKKNKSNEVKQILQLMREHHDNHKFLFQKISQYIKTSPEKEEMRLKRFTE